MMEVEGPDGVVYEFPEGTPQETITTIMRERYGGPQQGAQPSATPPAQQAPRNTATWGHANDFTGAATFGLLDDVQAAGGAVGRQLNDLVTGRDNYTWGSAYDEALTDVRGARDQHRDDNPVTSTAAQLAGGVYTGGVGGKYIANAPNVINAAGRSGVVGAGYGMGAGFGYGEGGLGNRIDSAALGGVLGGALGAAMPPVMAGFRAVGEAGRKAVGRIADAVSDTGQGMPPHVPDGAPVQIGQPATPRQTAAAQREIAARMQRDGITPDDVGYQMRLMGDDATLADAGGASTQRLLDTTAQLPGRTAQAVDDVFTSRQLAQADRIKAAAQGRLGTQGGFYETLDDLNAQMRKAASPLYRQAYADNPVVDTPQLRSFLNRPAVKDALRRAERMMRNEDLDPTAMGIQIDDAGNVTFTEAPSLQTWDYVKRGLDDVLDTYRDKTTGRLVLDTEGQGIENLRQAYVAALDDATGGADSVYAAARAAWAGPARQKEALQVGRDLFRQDSEITSRRIADMANDERAAFLEGVTRAVQDLVDRTGDTSNTVRRLFGNPRMRGILEAAFDDPKQFARFESDLLREATFAETRGAVAGGSQTFRRLAENAEPMAEVVDVGMQAAAGNPGAAGAIGRTVFRAGTPESVRNEIGRILLSRNPNDLAPIHTTFQDAIRRETSQNAGTATAYLASLLMGPEVVSQANASPKQEVARALQMLPLR